MESKLSKGTPSDPQMRAEVREGMKTKASAKIDTETSSTSTWADRAKESIKSRSKPALYRPVSSAATAGWKFDLNEKHVNVESRERTVVLNLRGRNPAATSTDTVLAAFTANGIDSTDVVAIFKSEDQRQVQVTFGTKETAENLLMNSEIKIAEFVEASVEPVRSDYHQVRVHWVPDYVQNSFLSEVFGRVGKVLSVAKTREKSGMFGCVRIIHMKADWQAMEAVPHTMAIRYQGQVHRLLITIKGRPPLCLLCSEIGHTRRECPRSPAAVRAREAKEAQDFAANMLAHRQRVTSDSDSDDEELTTSQSIIDPPAPPTDFADPPPPPVTTPTPTLTQAESMIQNELPHADTIASSLNLSNAHPSSPKDKPVVDGQFTDSDIDPESQIDNKRDSQSESSTQATASWAEEMDNLEAENEGEDDERMDSQDTHISQFSTNSIPCAQLEKHDLVVGRSGPNKRKGDEENNSQKGRGRAKGRRK